MAQEITLLVSHKLDAYLAQLVAMEGFGGTRGEVIQNLVWERVNDLIATKRLAEIPAEQKEPYEASRFCGPPSFCDCARYVEERNRKNATRQPDKD